MTAANELISLVSGIPYLLYPENLSALKQFAHHKEWEMPELPSALDKKLASRLIDHMVSGVSACELLSDPFPHFIHFGLLPGDFFTELLSMLPPQDAYEAFGYEKHHTASGNSNRLRFTLDNSSLDQLSSRHKRLWYTVRHAFGSAAFKSTVFKKLQPGLKLRYGRKAANTDNLSGFALPELFRETEGYFIAPHPDTRKKVVTMQFSMAADDSQVDLGTEFYRRSTNPAAWLRQPRGFDVVKQMPFLPNTVYAFSVLNTIRLKSWHGRTSIGPQKGIRNSLLNIWYENVENANVELAEECGLITPRTMAA